MKTRTPLLLMLTMLLAGCAAEPVLAPITMTNGQGEIACALESRLVGPAD